MISRYNARVPEKSVRKVWSSANFEKPHGDQGPFQFAADEYIKNPFPSSAWKMYFYPSYVPAAFPQSLKTNLGYFLANDNNNILKG